MGEEDTASGPGSWGGRLTVGRSATGGGPSAPTVAQPGRIDVGRGGARAGGAGL